MKDWILYNWKEISVVLYLLAGLPFAYVWTGEEFKKNTEDPYYSNRYSRNYWFTYVLIFCVCVLFWPLKFIINMMKKAVERRRKKKALSFSFDFNKTPSPHVVIPSPEPKRTKSAEAYYPEPKINIETGHSTFLQRIDQWHHENWLKEMDKPMLNSFTIKKNG